MAKRDRSHEVISAIKQLASELGRAPTREEFRDRTNLERACRDSFRVYTAALHAAGFLEDSMRNGRAGPKKFRFKLEKIQGFFVETVDLDALFEQAGNPEVLKMIVQPDTHVPFHDDEAVEAMLEFSRWYKPHSWIILGDFADCEGMSHWPSGDAKPRRFVPEVKAVRDMLARITEASPTVSSRFYLCGNHEAWIEQGLNAKIPEFMDGLGEIGIDLSVPALFQLEQSGYEFVPLNHLLRIGKAHFTHGIYVGGAHAKKHIDVFKCNLFYGHLHDINQSNQTSIDGHIEAASLGCLSRLDAKFLKGRPNNWVHSFACFEFRRDGKFSFVLNRIFDGQFSYSGRLFGKKPCKINRKPQ